MVLVPILEFVYGTLYNAKQVELLPDRENTGSEAPSCVSEAWMTPTLIVPHAAFPGIF